jgi:AraC-like DNA-binding protein
VKVTGQERLCSRPVGSSVEASVGERGRAALRPDNRHMLQVFRPPPEAAHWIDGAVIVRLAAGAGASRFPAMPHAMLTVRLLHAADGSMTAPAPCGPVSFHTLSTRPVAYAHAGEITALGLLVRPAAAACLLGHATGALADQVLGWDLLAGADEAARLAAELQHAGGHLQRLRALVASLRRALATASRGRDADLARLCHAVGLLGAQAGDQLGLGRRQLERRCQAVLGVAPKQFQRLVRFQQALSAAVTGGTPRLAETALDAGFYDQSHLARDVRQLAGAPLGRLLAAARPDSSWWSLATRRSLHAAGVLHPTGAAG